MAGAAAQVARPPALLGAGIMTDAIIDQTPNPDAPADSDLVAIYPGAPSTGDPDPRELGGGFLAWLKGLFSPKAADRWANYSNDFGQWAEVRADSLGLVAFFTGAPAAATLVVWDDYDAGKDLSGVTRIRVSKTLVGSDNYFADANAAFAGPEDEDRLVLHGDSPFRLSPSIAFTLTADAVSGGGGGVPEYWDLTGTTAQTGGNFIPGGEGFLRITDAAPGGLVIPSNRIGLNGTFGARIVRLFEALPLAWLKRLRKIVQGNNETETLRGQAGKPHARRRRGNLSRQPEQRRRPAPVLAAGADQGRDGVPRVRSEGVQGRRLPILRRAPVGDRRPAMDKVRQHRRPDIQRAARRRLRL